MQDPSRPQFHAHFKAGVGQGPSCKGHQTPLWKAPGTDGTTQHMLTLSPTPPSRSVSSHAPQEWGQNHSLWPDTDQDWATKMFSLGGGGWRTLQSHSSTHPACHILPSFPEPPDLLLRTMQRTWSWVKFRGNGTEGEGWGLPNPSLLLPQAGAAVGSWGTWAGSHPCF